MVAAGKGTPSDKLRQACMSPMQAGFFTSEYPQLHVRPGSKKPPCLTRFLTRHFL